MCVMVQEDGTQVSASWYAGTQLVMVCQECVGERGSKGGRTTQTKASAAVRVFAKQKEAATAEIC